jgi:hypothetical protein
MGDIDAGSFPTLPGRFLSAKFKTEAPLQEAGSAKFKSGDPSQEAEVVSTQSLTRTEE